MNNLSEQTIYGYTSTNGTNIASSVFMDRYHKYHSLGMIPKTLKNCSLVYLFLYLFLRAQRII